MKTKKYTAIYKHPKGSTIVKYLAVKARDRFEAAQKAPVELSNHPGFIFNGIREVEE